MSGDRKQFVSGESEHRFVQIQTPRSVGKTGRLGDLSSIEQSLVDDWARAMNAPKGKSKYTRKRKSR